MLGEPTSLDLGPDGGLYVADRINSAVYRLNPRDTSLTGIADTGPGPGEVQEPVDVEATGEALLVADLGNGRVQELDLDGTFRDQRPLPVRGTILLDLAPDGRVVSHAAGGDPARAALYGVDGERLADFGDDPFEAPRTVSVARMRSRAARGEVPEIFRLAVLPRFDSEGNVWLALRADGVMQKYRTDGSFVLERSLEGSEIREIRDAYVQANARAESGVTPLNYVADFEDVGGELWVLLNRPEDRPAVFVVLSRAGDVLRRIRLPSVLGAKTFAVDEDRGRLYLGVPSLALILLSPNSAMSRRFPSGRNAG